MSQGTYSCNRIALSNCRKRYTPKFKSLTNSIRLALIVSRSELSDLITSCLLQVYSRSVCALTLIGVERISPTRNVL